MVKVFPNSSFTIFKGQKFVKTVSEPVAVDCSRSHVFLATKSCTIEAHAACTETLTEPQIAGEFSTIHPVSSLVYTTKGDCLVTSEAKTLPKPWCTSTGWERPRMRESVLVPRTPPPGSTTPRPEATRGSLVWRSLSWESSPAHPGKAVACA